MPESKPAPKPNYHYQQKKTKQTKVLEWEEGSRLEDVLKKPEPKGKKASPQKSKKSSPQKPRRVEQGAPSAPPLQQNKSEQPELMDFLGEVLDENQKQMDALEGQFRQASDGPESKP